MDDNEISKRVKKAVFELNSCIGVAASNNIEVLLDVFESDTLCGIKMQAVNVKCIKVL